jgi:cytochrome P450
MDTYRVGGTGPTVPVPSYVDPALVVDFDYHSPPGLAEHGDVYRAWKVLREGPDIVWTPRHGGHWIVTRGEDIKWVQETFEVFSHREFAIPRGFTPHLPPITLDPPENIPYRAVLNPIFAKRRIEEHYVPRIRDLTVGLVEKIRPQGRCDFINEFAKIMPVVIFLGIADLPLERREEFLEWHRGFANAETRPAFEEKISAFLGEEIRKKEMAEPSDDLLGRIAAWRHNPRFKGADEQVAMAKLLFSGGLDTVATQFTFSMLHLARNPHLQDRLRREPEIIPAAVEELLRRHGLSNTGRIVVAEAERKGARFMPDDMVMVPIGLSSMDDRLYDNPLEVDFDRAPAPHNTFGNGPHKCVGAPLARAEFKIFLEEWFSRLPNVRVDPDLPPVTHAGALNGVSRLQLLWDL